MLRDDRYYAAPQRDPFVWERYEIAESLARLPALSLKVLFRFGVGLRRAEPGQLLLLYVLLIILNSFASMAEWMTNLPTRAAPWGTYVPHPHWLPSFALAVLVVGLWQHRNRWREIRSGKFRWHTYSDGVSPFEIVLYALTPDWLLKRPFLFSPGWWLAEARITRFVDPLALLALGYSLEPYDWILATWILFAALCLVVDESLMWHKALTIHLDMIDSKITANALKEWNDATSGKRPSHSARSAGKRSGAIVQSGIGKDIRGHLKAQERAARRKRPVPETILPAEVGVEALDTLAS